LQEEVIINYILAHERMCGRTCTHTHARACELKIIFNIDIIYQLLEKNMSTMAKFIISSSPLHLFYFSFLSQL